MKLSLEPKDIKEIQGVASDCGAALTEEEVIALVENDRCYAGEIYKWGPTDTEAREKLFKILQKLGKC